MAVTLPTDLKQASLFDLAYALRELLYSNWTESEFEQILELADEIVHKTQLMEAVTKTMQ